MQAIDAVRRSAVDLSDLGRPVIAEVLFAHHDSPPLART